jgi:hypothetical protein
MLKAKMGMGLELPDFTISNSINRNLPQTCMFEADFYDAFGCILCRLWNSSRDLDEQ